jgi:hypothetical protein
LDIVRESIVVNPNSKKRPSVRRQDYASAC